MNGDVWAGFAHDPRRPENATLRASDRDRDVVNEILATAYADGRLTPEEFDERSDQVVSSKTLGDLPPIVADLVAPSALASGQPLQAEAERRYRRQLQESLWAFLTPTVICFAVWMFAGFGFPWPVFVAIGTGMRFARLATSRQDSTEAIRRSLERKEQRRQERRELGRSEGVPSDDDVPGEED